MLENKVIFIFGLAKFDAEIESTSYQSAKFLAEKNDVYYIEHPYTIKDYMMGRGSSEFEKRRSKFFSSDSCIIGTSLPRLKIIIPPPLLSINFISENQLYRFLLSINEALIVKRLKRIIASKNIKEFIFINSFNFHYPNVGASLKPALLVYHCVDPLVVEYDRRHGIMSEKRIVKSSDLVICTSKQLYREKVIQNANTYFIPNAADINHSSKALDPQTVVSSLLRDIRTPIIGYFGNIERRIDFNLLDAVVKANPDKSFVFVGPKDEKYIPDDFNVNSNVHFIGKVPYSQMPAILKGFNVAIIPFAIDEVSATIFPLKLFEYLGAGKPVVSTEFNSDLKDFTGNTVHYCVDPDAFSAAINFALSNNSPKAVDERLSVAAKNTWQNRLTEFSTLILLKLQGHDKGFL